VTGSTDLYRQEAIGIPNLLVAPKESTTRDIYENGIGDYRGRYEDGAYYAPDDETLIGGYEEFEEEVENPRTTYYDSILSRYEVLREQLQQCPPEEAVASLDSDHPTSLGKLEMAVVRWWKWKIRTSDPLPVQVASMDKGTVLRLLGLITSGKLLKRGAQVEIGVSRWSWALLARLPERGELTSEEIGVVRELGKKAVAVGSGLREDRDWDERMDELEANYDDEAESGYEDNNDGYNAESNEHIHDNSHGIGSKPVISIGPQLPPKLEEQWQSSALPKESPEELQGREGLQTLGDTACITNTVAKTQNESKTDDDIATVKARILSRLNESNAEESVPGTCAQGPRGSIDERDAAANARWNTKATVDMIVTIVGEMYGQRDLLEDRSVWEDVV